MRLFTQIPSKTPTVSTSVQSENAHVLYAEVMTLLEKGAIERVPPAQSKSDFYSDYFLVPNKDGGLRPSLDLRHLNHALMRSSLRMITQKQILSQIRTGDWFFSLDLKGCILSHSDSPPSQTILEIRHRGSGLSVHGPSLSD